MAKLPDDAIKQALRSAEEDGSDDITLEEIESFGNEESIQRMFQDVDNYNRMLRESITFINRDITKAIPFTRENLYLICGMTGHGKSTIAANVSFPLWKQQKKVLILSNEEGGSDILFRIGCLQLGYNFNDYKKGRMPVVRQEEVKALYRDISQYVKVVDVVQSDGATARAEFVKNALDKVKDADFSCVMIDYFQNINQSSVKPQANTYEVLDDLRKWLGRYIKDANLPVVLFAQLHSVDKRSKAIDSRIKDCPKIIEPSTVIIEVIPNVEDRTSDFIIQKDRFGFQGSKVICGFDRGRFVIHDSESVKKAGQHKAAELEAKADPDGDMSGQQDSS